MSELDPTQSHASRAGAILAGNIVPQIAATIVVIARFVSKGYLRRSWGADDSVLALAWLSSLTLTICSCVQTKYGAGMHDADVPDWAMKPSFQLRYGTVLLYSLVVSLTKISVCLFYLRVFANRTSRYLSIACIVFVCLYTIPIECLNIFQCQPIDAAYDPVKIATAKCIDTMPGFYISAGCSIFVDIWLIVQVVPMILPLQVPRRQKIALIFVVSLGWIIIVASIVRLVRLSRALKSSDKNWDSYDASIWTAIECNIGLICVSAPATKPLLQKMAPEFMRSLSNPTSYPAGTYQLQSGKRRTGAGTFPLRSEESGLRSQAGIYEHEDSGVYGGKSGRTGPGGTFWETTVTARVRGDGESEEEVLAGVRNAITKNIEVTVESADKGSSGAESFVSDESGSAGPRGARY
ncbi:uncharacterized protein K452DRAFT_283107 [Aplosporella prunicola CBS 121167]|uniref:Rhodopsin domain-containing protein n=1 Tax=Aplosporella prunicola CBS 121167 TaxID=1176127 RepID=A0A6A6BVM6_9PEZI|nr:uncharacterized protein K452DRAFT_283107 [Aplosporella prunicola CBS 121167]KAF2146907.1 hypothetical protein K452DRAFT_283107 [Aplosporella prunicola CBS 121167]